MNIKELFAILPEPKSVIIDGAMVNKYRSVCNYGEDDYVEAHKKIIRAVSLGKKVYRYNDEIIIRYFDINYSLIDMGNTLILKNIWRNKKQYEIVKISEIKKGMWNKKYGIISHNKAHIGVNAIGRENEIK